MQITIDGPAGAGKSTVAKAIAAKLRYIYIDTGAMYRAITWLALQEGVDLTNETKLTNLAFIAKINIKRLNSGRQIVLCNDHDVTNEIRSLEINRNVSKVSAVMGVRRALVKTQQAMALGRNVVMDGRDAGTVILPQADYKIFLTASVEVRARRRFNQQKRFGINQDISAIIEEIKQRDYQDMNRKTSPLEPANDAIILDNSQLNLHETIDKILEITKLSI